jgi:hypothetical protein
MFFFLIFIENNTHILIIKKDVIIYQGRKIKIRDYRKKIIQYPSFPYSSKVHVFYALHMQRERERERAREREGERGRWYWALLYLE